MTAQNSPTLCDMAASATSMTPQALRALPEAARRLFQQAVTDGITALLTQGASVSPSHFCTRAGNP